MIRTLSQLTLAHLVIIGAFCVVAALVDSVLSVKSVALGGVVGLFGMLSLIVAWKNIFDKKHVALSVLLIVIKYAILGGIIFAVSTRSDLPLGWFALGLAATVLTLSISAKPLEKALFPEATGGSSGGSL